MHSRRRVGFAGDDAGLRAMRLVLHVLIAFYESCTSTHICSAGG
jgi:hypothetical protein